MSHTRHSTNQTAENVIHVDHKTYSHAEYNGGVSEISVVEVTYLTHTVRDFTLIDALRRLADELENDMGFDILSNTHL